MSTLKKRFLIHFLQIFTLLFLFSTSIYAKEFNDSDILHVDYPEWFDSNEFLDLSELVKNAATSEKKGLMILFTTQGCSYCSKFIQDSLGDQQLADYVKKHFISVGLEIFDDAELTDPQGKAMPVKQFAEIQGAGFAPTLLFFDTAGKRILDVVGYQSPQRFRRILDYLAKDHYLSETLHDYALKNPFENDAKVLSSKSAKKALHQDRLFMKPPYALDRHLFASSQPLLVLFEKPDCNDCDNFHEKVMTLKEIREQLKNFDVVRLNTEDAKTPIILPSGGKLNPAAWFKQTGFSQLPAFLFFDEKGNEVLKTDALVLRQRLLNSLSYVLERSYEKGWTYQRHARSKSIEKQLKKEKP